MRGHQYCRHGPTPVGVWFGEPGGVRTPTLARKALERAASSAVGAWSAANWRQNTLDKNYLYLAENRGVKIIPETRVTG